MRSNSGSTSRRWSRHASPIDLLSAVAGRSVASTGDIRLVAVDREVRRQRDLAFLAGFLQVEIAVERAVEEAGKEARFPRSPAPGRAPRGTSGPGRPTTRPASAGRRRPCRSAGCGTPGSARGGRPHPGRPPSPARSRDAAQRGRGGVLASGRAGIRRGRSRGSRGRACARPARGCEGSLPAGTVSVSMAIDDRVAFDRRARPRCARAR